MVLDRTSILSLICTNSTNRPRLWTALQRIHRRRARDCLLRACSHCDVAEAHLQAYELPIANYGHYLVTGGIYSFQQIGDILRTFLEPRDKMPEGKPGPFSEGEVYKVDTTKAETELSMSFISLEKCVKDTAENLIKPQRRSGRQCRRCQLTAAQTVVAAPCSTLFICFKTRLRLNSSFIFNISPALCNPVLIPPGWRLIPCSP